jgi:hypothetical protein
MNSLSCPYNPRQTNNTTLNETSTIETQQPSSMVKFLNKNHEN